MKRVKLGDICIKQFSKYAQKDLDELDGNYPVYGASGLIKKINVYHQEKEYVAVVKDGAGIGRTMYLPAKSSVIGTLQYLIPKDDIDAKYLYYAVKSRHLEKYYTGAAIPHIYFKDYQNEPILLHGTEEQKQIVSVLERVENIIKIRKQELQHLDGLIQSRFVEMFGNDDEFLQKAQNQVSDICNSRVGIVIQPTQYYTDDPNGVKAFRSLNIKPFYVNDYDWVFFSESDNAMLNRTQVRTDDVAVVRSGVNLGDSCVIPEIYNGCNAIDILLLTCTADILPIYLSAFINYPVGKQQILNIQRGGAIKHLNLKQLESSRIYVPDLTLQKQFAAFVTQTDKSKIAVQKTLEESQLLFDSLMQKYFG